MVNFVFLHATTEQFDFNTPRDFREIKNTCLCDRVCRVVG